MTIAHASLLLLLIACGNKESPKPGMPSTSAPTSSSAPAAPTTTAGTLVFGDATIYELVSRTWEKRDPPLKKLVMHPDGRVDTYNAKTGRVRGSLFVKADGTVTFEDGKPFAVIGEREIKPAGSR